MGRIKLIASDLDGTLLQHGTQRLRSETCGLIHQLHEQGRCAGGNQNTLFLTGRVEDTLEDVLRKGGSVE